MLQALQRQRRLRLAVLGLVLLGVGWAGSGAWVTWRLTRRARPVRLHEVEALAGRVSSHARLEVFREGNHGTLWDSEPERYPRLLLDFVRACVRR